MIFATKILELRYCLELRIFQILGRQCVAYNVERVKQTQSDLHHPLKANTLIFLQQNVLILKYIG